MTIYRIRFEGSPAHALGVATALADAQGVELISSEPPSTFDETTVSLDLTVDGALDAVTAAVARVRDGMPAGCSIEMVRD